MERQGEWQPFPPEWRSARQLKVFFLHSPQQPSASMELAGLLHHEVAVREEFELHVERFRLLVVEPHVAAVSVVVVRLRVAVGDFDGADELGELVRVPTGRIGAVSAGPPLTGVA